MIGEDDTRTTFTRNCTKLIIFFTSFYICIHISKVYTDKVSTSRWKS